MIWLLLACGGQTAEQAVAGLVSDGSLAACQDMALVSAQTTCWVTAAAHAAGEGDVDSAEAACANLDGRWADECHFRAGEELGRAGFTDPALRQCAQAGDFSRNCVTHAAWGLPRTDLSPAQPARVGPAMDEFAAVVTGALTTAPDGVQGEALDTLLSRSWFNLYVGSGVADPTAARAADADWAAHARTAWAIEASRLVPLGDDPLADVVAIWNGAEPPVGERLERVEPGRYTQPLLPSGMESHPHTQTYGGGIRLVLDDPDQDLRVAVLEGLFWRHDVPASAFEPYLADPQDAVRWTAWKLYGLTGGQGAAPTDPTSEAYLRLARKRRQRIERQSPRGPSPPAQKRPE